MRYVGDGMTLPRSEVARWIEVCRQKYAERGYGTSAVFEKTTGNFIGYCGVVRAPGNDFDELIYVFHRSAWGQGYAGEAGRAMLGYMFAHSSLSKIYATIYADNHTSRKVADKLGMTVEKINNPDGKSVVILRHQPGHVQGCSAAVITTVHPETHRRWRVQRDS